MSEDRRPRFVGARVACVLCVLAAPVSSSSGCRRPAPAGELGRAAAAGDRARLAVLLQKTAADTPEDGWGALVWAVRNGQLDSVAQLVDAGADVNRPDHRQGWTPLMHALHTKHAAVARLLLARGADPRIGAGNTSPLQMAALDNDAALVRLMLAARIPRELRQESLDLAVSGGALADIDRPLFGSCKSEVARVLLADDPSLAVDVSGGLFSPLWWARRQRCDATLALVAARSHSRVATR